MLTDVAFFFLGLLCVLLFTLNVRSSNHRDWLKLSNWPWWITASMWIVAGIAAIFALPNASGSPQVKGFAFWSYGCGTMCLIFGVSALTSRSKSKT